jgi:hypothetical protein
MATQYSYRSCFNVHIAVSLGLAILIVLSLQNLMMLVREPKQIYSLF